MCVCLHVHVCMCACEHVCVQACMCFFNQQQHVVSPRFPPQSVLVEDSGGRTLETAVMKCLMPVPRAGTHGRAGRREGGGLPLRASRGHRGSRKVGEDSFQTACGRSCSLHVLAVRTEPQNLSLTREPGRRGGDGSHQESPFSQGRPTAHRARRPHTCAGPPVRLIAQGFPTVPLTTSPQHRELFWTHLGCDCHVLGQRQPHKMQNKS